MFMVFWDVTPCNLAKRNLPCHAMKAQRRIQVQLHSFLALALEEAERATSCSSSFIPGKNPGIH
jgi:hypothetical protein